MAGGTIWLNSTRSVLEGRINWSSSSNGSSRNSSNVYAELQIRRNDGYSTTGTWSGSLEIAGDSRGFSLHTTIRSDWVTLISFSIERWHESNGFGNCYISGVANGPSGTSMAGHSVSGNQTVTLDWIPRYATNTSVWLLNNGLNSVELKWYTDNVCSAIKYGFDSNNLQEISVNTNSSTFRINGLKPSTYYVVYFNVKRKDSGLYLTSNLSVSFTTFGIAKLTSTPDVTIGKKQTITWTNPGNATTSLKLCKTDGTVIKDIGKVTGGRLDYTADANTIYNLTPNSNTFTARYILTTTSNNVSYTDARNFNFYVSDANPYYTKPSTTDANYEETEERIYALTNDRHKIVKGFSNIKITIDVANYHAQKGANLTDNGANFSVIMDNERVFKKYADAKTFSFTDVRSYKANLYVKDSRGNVLNAGNIIRLPADSASVTYFLDYFTPIIRSATATRTNEISEETTLSFNGIFWNKSFGAVSNTLKKVTYKYRETNSSTFSDETDITSSVKTSGNNFNASLLINGDLGAKGFTILKSFYICVEVVDELGSYQYTILLDTGTPALAIVNGNKLAQGKKYDTSLGGDFQMNGDVKVDGTLSIGNNKISDATIKAVWTEKSGLKVSAGIDETDNYRIWDHTNQRDILRYDKKDNAVQASGFRSTNTYDTGNTQSSSAACLVIKPIQNLTTSQPNNGVILEYGMSTKWKGQLFISDNASDGLYYNGWNNNIRGTWKRIYDDSYHPAVSFDILYNNTNGTNGNITLSASAANYKTMLIQFDVNKTKQLNSTMIYYPQGQIEMLDILNPYSLNNIKNIEIISKKIKINNTSITNMDYGYSRIANAGQIITNAENYIYIYTVIGWK